MLCMNCGQNEAEIFIKQIIDQEVCDLHLCRECAEKLGHIDKNAPSITISFSLKPVPIEPSNRVDQLEDRRWDALTCPECGLAFAEFRKSGRLGCERCYEEFRVPLGDFFQKYHGVESHWVGTSKLFDELEIVERAEPRPTSRDLVIPKVDSRITELRCELDDALNHEEYERASKIRDEIKEIEAEGEDDAERTS